jgi:esterase/lipase
MKLVASFSRNMDLASNYAHETNYPYQLMLAEKDHLISNKIARVWHEKTKSKDKNMRLIVGAYHELTKEKNNHKVFETMLGFMR